MPVSSSNNLSLSKQQLQDILVCLRKIRKDGQAEYVLLADISGQLIEHTGASNNINPPILAALAAGEVAATREIAQLMGEDPGFKLILHEGKQKHIYLSEVNAALILTVIFRQEVPIGMVRLITRMAVETLQEIIAEDSREEDVSWSSTTTAAEFETWLTRELNILDKSNPLGVIDVH
jgi:predicted regulator of Ras-like GTPase activity (Roadblock/LC7/MglB family)